VGGGKGSRHSTSYGGGHLPYLPSPERGKGRIETESCRIVLNGRQKSSLHGGNKSTAKVKNAPADKLSGKGREREAVHWHLRVAADTMVERERRCQKRRG